MVFPVILAHGALGNWDELIFIGVVVTFIIMMGVSWVRSRNIAPEFDEPPAEQTPESESEPASSDEHFELK